MRLQAIKTLAATRKSIKEIARSAGRTRKLVCNVLRSGDSDMFRYRIRMLELHTHAPGRIGGGAEFTRKAPPVTVLSLRMTTLRHSLSKADAVTVAATDTGVPILAAARDLMKRFHRLFRVGDTDAPATWAIDASASLLASFRKGIVADLVAVRVALIDSWSNGQTEGHITKL